MALAFRVAVDTVRDLFEEMFLLIVCNVIWVMAIVPVVTLPAATGALFCVTHKIAEGRGAALSDFRAGFRTYFRQSSLLGLVNGLVILIFVSNATFYGRYSGLAFRLIQLFFWYVLILWLLGQLYVFPLLLEQEEPSLRLAIRNALVLLFRHPLFSLVIGLAALLIAGLSVVLVLPLMLLTTSTLALLGSHAVLALLDRHREVDREQALDEGWNLDET